MINSSVNPSEMRQAHGEPPRRSGTGTVRLRTMVVPFFCAAVIASLCIARHEHLSERRVREDMQALKERYELVSHQVDTLQALVTNINYHVDFIYQLAFSDMSTDPVFPALDAMHSANCNKSDSSSLSMLFVNVALLQRKVFLDSRIDRNLLSLAVTRQQLFAAVPGRSPLANMHLKGGASGYGLRLDPYDRMLMMMHKGIDFAAPVGTPVYATAEGQVVAADTAFLGYGTMVIVDHGHGYQTRYAHLGKFVVSAGERVIRGQVIGQVGNTGRSTAPHLHYEVLLQGVPINPIHFLRREGRPPGNANLASQASLQH